MDKDLATRGQDNATLWRYGFALLVAAASLSVFVARTFDASASTPVRASGVLMALAFSAALYVLLIADAVRRLIHTHPPLRSMPGSRQDKGARLPLLYRILNPKGMALVSIGIVLLLLPHTPTPGAPDWFRLLISVLRYASVVFFLLGGAFVSLWEGRKLRGRLGARFEGSPNFLTTPLMVIAWAGFSIVMMGSLVEAIHRAEAGIAMVGVACIPVLFLGAAELLRWVTFDHSAERMERLRLNAHRLDWPAERIEDAYFAIEHARARGPAPQAPE